MLVKRKLSLSILLVFLSSLLVQAQLTNRIEHQGDSLFLSGGNIAWLDFGRDVGPGTTRLSELETMFQNVKGHGGNTMRFWVHITGSNTPAWSGNTVIGPGNGTVEDMRDILDAAWENNIGLVLSLWSFDMLRTSNGTGVTNRTKAMLEDSTLTQNYIDNALVPIVEALGDHPGIIAWEIFNEPEGMSNEFGWDFTRHVRMSDIQRFINQTAGAIHRANPNAKVTNGAWSFHSLTNTSRQFSKNYYSDNELIGAGKDSLGYLDFYQVHYYSWAGTELSPFHNDADTWGLDKPIVVGEFGIPDELFGIDGSELYETLYQRGYAGSWVWQWVDWYSNRGTYAESWLRGLDQMEKMSLEHPNDVVIGELTPFISDFSASPDEIAIGDSTELSWTARYSDAVTLNGEIVNAIDTIFAKPTSTTEYELIGITEGRADTAYVTVTIVEATEVNRAFKKEVTTLEDESCCGNDDATKVVDGDPNTRWASEWKDNQWIYVDLGEVVDVSEVVLNWEVAYGNSYNIDVSVDANSWNTVFEERNGDGEIDIIDFSTPIKGRYVRMFGLERATTFGFSLWEFEVKGVPSSKQPIEVSLKTPKSALEVLKGSNVQLELEKLAGSGSIERVTFMKDRQDFISTNADPYVATIENVEEGNFTISASVVESNGYTLQTNSVQVSVLASLDKKRLEAEEAIISGNISQQTQPAGVSNGGYVKMEDSGTIAWKNVGLGNGDKFDLRIRYRLPFGNKNQELLLNGEVSDTLFFTGNTSWNVFDTTITVSETLNEIGIQKYFGYMDFDYMEISINALSVSNEDDSEAIPENFMLNQNYPNPFNPTTIISYDIPKAGVVKLSVYNMLGQNVANLINKQQSAGSYDVQWDAKNVSSGIYIYRLEVGSFISTKKMILVK